MNCFAEKEADSHHHSLGGCEDKAPLAVILVAFSFLLCLFQVRRRWRQTSRYFISFDCGTIDPLNFICGHVFLLSEKVT